MGIFIPNPNDPRVRQFIDDMDLDRTQNINDGIKQALEARLSLYAGATVSGSIDDLWKRYLEANISNGGEGFTHNGQHINHYANETTFTFAAMANATISVPITADINDGRVNVGSGIWTDAGAIFVGEVATFQFQGAWHFPKVNILQGSTIVSATLDITVSTEDDQSGTFTITAQDVDNAQWPPTSTPPGVPTTWSLTSGNSFGQPLGVGAKSIDCSVAIQAIVNRAGWRAKNAINLKMTNPTSGHIIFEGYPTVGFGVLSVVYTP